MKSLFLAVVAIFLGPGGAVQAGDLPVYFTGKVSGDLVASVLTREKFDFEPGKVNHCIRKDVLPYLSSFVCEISDTVATVSQTGGKSLSVKLEKLVAFYKNHKSGNYYEYIYNGTSAEGPVRLVLWHYVLTPQIIRGSIAFEGLGLTVPIVAAPVKP